MSEEPAKLVTLAEYEELNAFSKGFWQYWQGAHPGSALKELRNPYAKDTEEFKEYEQGQAYAVQSAQDSEE